MIEVSKYWDSLRKNPWFLTWSKTSVLKNHDGFLPLFTGLLQSNYRQMIATRGSISHVASIFTQFTPLVPAIFGATLTNGRSSPSQISIGQPFWSNLSMQTYANTLLTKQFGAIRQSTSVGQKCCVRSACSRNRMWFPVNRWWPIVRKIRSPSVHNYSSSF